MAASIWRSFPCSRRQLRLDTVLLCGQSFRWRENTPGEWLGVIADRVWRLKQDDTHVYFQVYGESAKATADQTTLGCEIKTEREESCSLISNKQSSALSRKQDHTIQKQVEDVKRVSARNSSLLKQSKEPFQLADSQPIIKTEVLDGGYNTVSKTELGQTSSGQEAKDATKVLKQETKYTGSDIKPGKKDVSANFSGEKKPQNSINNTSNVKPESNKNANNDTSTDVSVLADYFQLGVDLDGLYHHWSQADPHFGRTAKDFWGIRMLRQDPVENLFAFICSSNNHISRIAAMVEKLCVHYGAGIAEVDGRLYHGFPPVSALAGDGVEEKLRELGFGYRAKFISKSARYIMDNHGEAWVMSLRDLSYEDAKAELMKLCGVGAKVADCVCLMSLDKTGALPVDTHVWQFAARHYLPKLQAAKSVTDKLYKEIGDHFRALWGPYAGWAHSVLFTAELRHMQSKKTAPDQSVKKIAKTTKKRQPTPTEDGQVAPPLSKASTNRQPKPAEEGQTEPKRSKASTKTKRQPTPAEEDQKRPKSSMAATKSKRQPTSTTAEESQIEPKRTKASRSKNKRT